MTWAQGPLAKASKRIDLHVEGLGSRDCLGVPSKDCQGVM